MNRRIYVAATLAVLAGVVMASNREARADDAAAAAATDSMAVARGAQAWGNNCSRCHSLREPKELRDDQWRPVVAHMRVRAGLTGAEARDILTFLQASN